MRFSLRFAPLRLTAARFLLPFVLGVALSSHAQAPAVAAAPAHPTSTPYTGDLSIFEMPGRDKRLQIQRVMDLLKIQKGTNVADIGAGSGWFTVRAAARTGDTGVVYAEDINPAAIDSIRQRATKEKLANIRILLGTPNDPKLPPTSVDVVLMLKTYHEIEYPQLLLANLKPSLRPGARIGIIDRSGNGADHGLMPDIVKQEMKQAGFRLIHTYDFTKGDGQDYFQIYQQTP